MCCRGNVQLELRGKRVLTLGPEGTDAQAEASRLRGDVVLVPSFGQAMELAASGQGLALVPTGFLHADGRTVVESWVDLHFRWKDNLRLSAVWESPTKEMCLAVRPEISALGDIRSVLVHPATREFAAQMVPHADLRFVTAKPLAVAGVVRGDADACIGSLDVAVATGKLRVLKRFAPTMIWCLYAPRVWDVSHLYEEGELSLN